VSDDSYGWKDPDGDQASWSDADWLRSMARANFVIEDIARADRIATEHGDLARYKAVVEAVIADFQERYADAAVWQWSFAAAIRDRLASSR
jgi:hypothetical protein